MGAHAVVRHANYTNCLLLTSTWTDHSACGRGNQHGGPSCFRWGQGSGPGWAQVIRRTHGQSCSSLAWCIGHSVVPVDVHIEPLVAILYTIEAFANLIPLKALVGYAHCVFLCRCVCFPHLTLQEVNKLTHVVLEMGASCDRNLCHLTLWVGSLKTCKITQVWFKLK